VKRCTKCGIEKPLEGFNKSSRAKDGRQTWCKPCQSAAVMASAKKNPDAKRRADEKYRQTGGYKANRKVRREGPQRERILEQKRGSWERNKDGANRRVREARVADPERFRRYYRRQYAEGRDKILAANREWSQANREKVRAYQRLREYGLAHEDFGRMLMEQGGRCAICRTEIYPVGGTDENGNKLTVACVDHCHESGAVRGLLCTHCNKALGHFKDDPARMRTAADYIEKRRDMPRC
jgi:Recombination endonuclease VII